jgi:hypothetical protein
MFLCRDHAAEINGAIPSTSSNMCNRRELQFCDYWRRTGKIVAAGKTGVRFGSMERGFRIIIPSPLNDMKTALEAGESALIEV